MMTRYRSLTTRLVSAIVLSCSGAAIAAVQAHADSTQPFSCTDRSGGVAGVTGTVTALRVAHHPGYDRLVLGFATSSAVPVYQIQRQASSTFIRDASGQPATLDGTAGIRLVFQGADIAAGVPSQIKPDLSEIREVRTVGNFERVVSYGVGLLDQACVRVRKLSGPSRLVLDVQTGPEAQPATTASSATSTGNIVATQPRSLAQTGTAAAMWPTWAAAATALGLGLAALGAVLRLRRRRSQNS